MLVRTNRKRGVAGRTFSWAGSSSLPVALVAGLLLAWLLGACGAEQLGSESVAEATADAGVDAPADRPSPRLFTVMSVNVGNVADECKTSYGNRICLTEVERAIAESLRLHRPDLVAVQEAFPSRLCNSSVPKDEKKLCHEYQTRTPRESIRRLLGADYTISCEDRNRSECIAVRTDSGKILGCDLGELCYWSTVPEKSTGCDPSFTVSSVVVKLEGAAFTVVNVHGNSKTDACRKQQLARVFEGDTRLIAGVRNLVLGTMSVDPFASGSTGPALEVWNRNVGPGKRFRYHSGTVEKSPPYPTTGVGRVWDHLVSDFALGACVTLGKAPGTAHLITAAAHAKDGIDHFALKCRLFFD